MNIDCMITLSRGGIKYNPNHLGKMKITKNRRGEEGTEVNYIRLNNGRFKILSDGVYSKIKGLSGKRNFTDGDINALEAEELRQNMQSTAQAMAQMAQQTANAASNSGGFNKFVAP